MVRRFIKDETISGKLVIVMAIIALVAVNSPLQNLFVSFWHTTFTVGFPGLNLSMDIKDWINEGLMTFFFLVVGLEIKREIVSGELRKFKTAILPIAAAIGGMIVPAAVFIAFNINSPDTVHGWAIPVATDIALAISVLALVGRGLPSQVRMFLLTLAIVDDIGAIIIVAIFYGSGFNLVGLFASITIAGALILIRKRKWLSLPLFAVMGVLLWLAVRHMGIEASITGAMLGFLAPVVNHAGGDKSLAERLEKVMIPFATLIVIPVFVLANAGVNILTTTITNSTVSLGLGIIIGLVIGKVVGVVGVSWLLVRTRVSRLPTGTAWRHLIGVGFIAGIGFTLSIFVSDLSFGGDLVLADFAKQSVFVGSIISAGIGIMILRSTKKSRVTRYIQPET
ncbi:MAG TPA: Na+/H+ antiporter NhaA [Candidatus Saccharibacteria bacterium]|nr:Na+/H+ antiporter NhaA [Candidatus Saccharibacteria bacterium]